MKKNKYYINYWTPFKFACGAFLLSLTFFANGTAVIWDITRFILLIAIFLSGAISLWYFMVPLVYITTAGNLLFFRPFILPFNYGKLLSCSLVENRIVFDCAKKELKLPKNIFHETDVKDFK